MKIYKKDGTFNFKGLAKRVYKKYSKISPVEILTKGIKRNATD